jgi:hypothetical protein
MRGGVRVIGYHGTSDRHAEEILRDGFRPSENDYDWLGTGVYFFEEDAGRALRWARQQWPDEPAVVAAAIDLANVLDLFDHVTVAELRHLASAFEQSARATSAEVPRNVGGRHKFDCTLIDLYCQLAEQKGTPTPVVRGLFEEGAPIHPHSGNRDLTHIQLAVRDPRAIIGAWKVRP